MTGFENAFGEITLVFFTTLAPSGAVAVMVLAGVLLLSRMSDAMRARVNKCLCIPLVFTMVGLVASATHLGNPSNALYVLMRVGASPLSNEVFAAVLFLGCTGLYWLHSFAAQPVKPLQRVLLVMQVVLGALFIGMVALAYSVDTISTWNLPTVPVLLWLNAFVGGPLLACLTLYCARWTPVFGHFGVICHVLAFAALIVATIVYAVQWGALQEMGNSVVDALQLVPGYMGMLATFTVLCCLGIATSFATLRKAVKSADWALNCNDSALAVGAQRQGNATPPRPKLDASRVLCLDGTTIKLIASCVLAFTGIFIMRFAFYMMHMTVGLAV